MQQNASRTEHKSRKTYIQSALKCFGKLDETFDDQITELGEHLLALLLQLVRWTAQQDHQGQKGVRPAMMTCLIPCKGKAELMGTAVS